jgi:nucleoid-associated protein YgaU
MLRSIRRQVTALSAPRRAALALVAFVAVSAPAAAEAQSASSDTHTVRSGDTLWDIARQYMSDPFLWPQIYRLNTAVVEDPHWIYPGEVLVLVARGPVAAVPAEDTPLPPAGGQLAAMPVDTASPDSVPAADSDDDSRFSLAINRGQYQADSLRLSTEAPVPAHSVTAGDFRTAPFLDEDQLGATGRVLGPVMPRQIGGTGAMRQTVLLGGDVVVTAPRGATYQVGDSLAVYGYDGKRIHPFGEVILPLGVVVVREQATTERYVARVARMFGPIHKGQLLLPLEPFAAIEAGGVAGEGVRGQIAGWPDFQRLKSLQDHLFLDRGTQDGVRVGDLYEIRRPIDDDRGVLVPITVARGRVVRVGERTATLKVVQVLAPDIPAGSEAIQIARMP